MQIPNVNCGHFERGGHCKVKPRRFFRLFMAVCGEADIGGYRPCKIAERHQKPEISPGGRGAKPKPPKALPMKTVYCRDCTSGDWTDTPSIAVCYADASKSIDFVSGKITFALCKNVNTNGHCRHFKPKG